MASWMFKWPYQEYRIPVGVAPDRQVEQMNSTTIRYYYVFQCEEDATITHTAFLQTGLNGSPGTLRVGIRTMDSNGIPSSTWTGYGEITTYSATNNDKYVWTAITKDNAGNTISSVSLQRGTMYCVAVEPTSGSWTSGGTGNNLTIGRVWRQLGGSPACPFGRHNTNGNQEGWPTYMIRSSTKAYGFNLAKANQVTSWSTSVNPDEIALSFKLPSQTGTFTVIGCEAAIGSNGAGNEVTVKLWSVQTAYSSVTLLQSNVFDLDNSRYPTQDQFIVMLFDEDTLTSLNYDQEYILSIEVTGGTSSTYRTFDVDNDYKDAITPGTIKYLTRNNGGTFAETTGVVPAINLLISTTTGGSGGGGLLVHPGMTGGARG